MNMQIGHCFQTVKPIFHLANLFARTEKKVGTLPTRVKTHKLLQVCKQVGTSLFTSCQQVVFALLVPILL